MDSCKIPTQVLRAYTAEGVVPFALEALRYGITLFARERRATDGDAADSFNPDDWYFLSEWNHVLGRHGACLIPKSHDIKLGGIWKE
jgi:4-dimethylallyltryptophan N-methyltransferase